MHVAVVGQPINQSINQRLTNTSWTVYCTRQDPSVTVKRHIRLLHEYNEIKDVGQGLMGLIADARGVRQVEVQREFGVGQAD